MPRRRPHGGRRQGRGRGDAAVVAGVAPRHDAPVIAGDDVARSRAASDGVGVRRPTAPRPRGGAASPSVIVVVVLVPLLVLGSGVGVVLLGARRARQARARSCTCSSSRAGASRGSPSELAGRRHHRLGARVQRLRALQRRQLVPGRHLRPAHEPRREGRGQGARRRARGSTTWCSRCRPACGSSRSRRGSASCPAAARSRSSQGTRNNAVRSVFEPDGVDEPRGAACGPTPTRSRTRRTRSRSSRRW